MSGETRRHTDATLEPWNLAACDANCFYMESLFSFMKRRTYFVTVKWRRETGREAKRDQRCRSRPPYRGSYFGASERFERPLKGFVKSFKSFVNLLKFC